MESIIDNVTYVSIENNQKLTQYYFIGTYKRVNENIKTFSNCVPTVNFS